MSIGNEMVSLGNEMDALLSRAQASAAGASCLLATHKASLATSGLELTAMIKMTCLLTHRTAGISQDARKRRA